MEFAIQILFSLCCHFGNELMLEEKKSNISKTYKCFTVYLSKKKCFVLLSSLHLSQSDFFYFDFFCTKSITILFRTLVFSICSVVFLCHFLLNSRPKYRSKNAYICVCFQIFPVVISRVKNLKKKIKIDDCKTVKKIFYSTKTLKKPKTTVKM